MHETTHFLAQTDLIRLPDENFLHNCRGENRSLVFVAAADESNNAERLVFLKKIMAALQLNLDSDALFTTLGPHESGSFFQLLKKRGIERMLVFGLAPRQFGLQIEVKPYEEFQFYGVRFLFSEKLSVVETDQTKKAQLWAALKRWNL